jgi:hypothetical protein
MAKPFVLERSLPFACHLRNAGWKPHTPHTKGDSPSPLAIVLRVQSFLITRRHLAVNRFKIGHHDKIFSIRCYERFETIRDGKAQRSHSVWRNEKDRPRSSPRGACGDQLKQMMVNHVARYLHPILFFNTMKASVHRNRLHVNAGNIRVSHAFPLSTEPLFRSRVRAL